jgi:hypothetical protein
MNDNTPGGIPRDRSITPEDNPENLLRHVSSLKGSGKSKNHEGFVSCLITAEFNASEKP